MLPGIFGKENSMKPLFENIYANKKVLVTGHTGFKGSWLCLWLKSLGAEVYGYSLPAQTDPSHWDLLNLEIDSQLGDIRDREKLDDWVAKIKPEFVFHLAAQPIVRDSYEIPADTFDINVVGTINVYEACRKAKSVRALVSITTDKVYENREWVWGYRENDPFGGYDPYSASKACAEIASASYRQSFWNIEQYGVYHHTLLATARAGNVIGGGDWAKDRLVPDLMVGASIQKSAIIRNPGSTRPWEHVLEPLSGYLLLGAKLYRGQHQFAEGWNFGPMNEGMLTVLEVIEALRKGWDQLNFKIESSDLNPHEAGLLRLDCQKARSYLKWAPVWDGELSFIKTAEWYKTFYTENKVITQEQLYQYIDDARTKGISWTL
jgi:CDP-glucose 4,6-dehydratase